MDPHLRPLHIVLPVGMALLLVLSAFASRLWFVLVMGGEDPLAWWALFPTGVIASIVAACLIFGALASSMVPNALGAKLQVAGALATATTVALFHATTDHGLTGTAVMAWVGYGIAVVLPTALCVAAAPRLQRRYDAPVLHILVATCTLFGWANTAFMARLSEDAWIRDSLLLQLQPIWSTIVILSALLVLRRRSVLRLFGATTSPEYYLIGGALSYAVASIVGGPASYLCRRMYQLMEPGTVSSVGLLGWVPNTASLAVVVALIFVIRNTTTRYEIQAPQSRDLRILGGLGVAALIASAVLFWKEHQHVSAFAMAIWDYRW